MWSLELSRRVVDGTLTERVASLDGKSRIFFHPTVDARKFSLLRDR